MQVYNYAVFPVIIGVSGCKLPRRDPDTLTNVNTVDCPTVGNVTLSIFGYFFGIPGSNPPTVVVGFTPTVGVVLPFVNGTNQSVVTFLLPPGIGADLNVTVRTMHLPRYDLSLFVHSNRLVQVILQPAGISSQPFPHALSYAAPSISNLSGCATSHPNRVARLTDCNRTGGDVVTIFGNNFGTPTSALQVRVLVGGQSCDVQYATESLIHCKLAPGRLLSNTIIIIQFNGTLQFIL